ncbi:MAG TPA: hypothetical protein DCS97_00110 [Planctomycetes bacterium]|nr:hypothetical protein [Planctomycetota bacterium]
MSKKPAFTEATIKKRLAEAPVSEEVRMRDPEVPGLVLWRRPNGKARWYVVIRAAGRIRRMPVGDVSTYEKINLKTARDLAKGVIGKLASGQDVAAERSKLRQQRKEARQGGKVPMAEALKRHLALLVERGRAAGHRAELKRVVEDAIAAGVSDLAAPGAAAAARTWLDKLKISASTRHRYRVHLCAVSKTAMRWWPPEVLARDPFLPLAGAGAPIPPPSVFTPAEAVRLLSDTALGLPGGRLWAFLLLSGCRFKEATWARWDRLNLDRATFDVVPPDAAEYEAGARVKRMKARTVHLGVELVALLRTWRPESPPPGAFLFPDEWRTRPHVYNVMDFRSHLEAVGIPLESRRIHTLRHTRQTLGLAAGEDSLRLRLSMGHAGEDMGEHYGRLAMRWRGLLASWGGELKLRDPAEVKRIAEAMPLPACPSTDACTVSA